MISGVGYKPCPWTTRRPAGILSTQGSGISAVSADWSAAGENCQTRYTACAVCQMQCSASYETGVITYTITDSNTTQLTCYWDIINKDEKQWFPCIMHGITSIIYQPVGKMCLLKLY